MAASGTSLLIATATVAAKAVVEDLYRRLNEVSLRDEAGAALAARFLTNGPLLDRFVSEVEAYADQQLQLQPVGRDRRRRAVDLARWSGSLFSLLLPWVSGDGPARAKKAAAARRDTEGRKEEIAAAASKLLLLMERNAGAMLNEIERGAPHLPIDVFLPRLRHDLHRLVDAATGRRRERRQQAEVEARLKDGLPPPKMRAPLPRGAEGFISEVDSALPFVLSSSAVIDLWQFVSGQVVGESAVRAARNRTAERTS